MHGCRFDDALLIGRIAVPRHHERRRRDDAGEGCQRERVLQPNGIGELVLIRGEECAVEEFMGVSFRSREICCLRWFRPSNSECDAARSIFRWQREHFITAQCRVTRLSSAVDAALAAGTFGTC